MAKVVAAKKPKTARKITRYGTHVLDDAKLLALIAEGHNFGALAKQFKVSKSAIYAIAARAKK